MTDDVLKLIFSRNAFYKRLHYLALAVFCLCLIATILLGIMLSYQLKNPIKPLYFATDNVGRLIKVVPVSDSAINVDVVQWTIDAVQRSYTFDYINYRNQLQSAEKYFTSYGWRNYMNALRESNNLLGVINRKLIGIARVTDKPKLITEGLLSGSYAWKFEMPVLVTYLQPPNYDESTQFSNALIVDVIVQRQQILEGYRGLGIVQLIGSMPAGGGAPAQISGSTA